jgi:SAM-dependent methyltransferase
VVWRLLEEALASVRPAVGAPRVLDCGGGTGTFAVPLAVAGADVTVVDVSADALAILTRRAAEAAVGERVHPIQADVETLAAGAPAGTETFDLVLAHGILEEVAAEAGDVAGTFAAIAAAVRPGGLLSLLVANPVAAVLARVLSGDPGGALGDLRRLDDGGGVFAAGRPATAGAVGLCEGAGLSVEACHGIGVFTDLVPGSALDRPGARDLLDQLEAETAARAPFADIAARVHVLGRRAGG